MKLQFGAALAALLLVSFMIMRVSSAAFSASTDTTDTWSSASVALTDDDGGSTTDDATFTSSTSMVPGDTEQACITVTYGGDIAAAVKLYGSTTTATSDLGQYLDLEIDEVSAIDAVDGGTCANPEGLVAGGATVTNIYTGTLSVNTGAFTVDHTDWSNGLASNWAPSGSGETQIYRITATLQDDNNAQGLDTTATFTWEAQNA